jgi:hypothetical protein
MVATAAPERAATIIEEGLNAMSREEREALRDEKRREIMWALDELLFREPTSSRALRALMRLAEAENEKYGNNATGVFGEAFHWQHPQLPLPLDERLGILRECTAEGAPRERRLVAIKAIETGLRQSASVMLRRGGGAIPLDARPRMTSGEVWDFIEELFDELKSLARSRDQVVAKAALAALPTALETIGAEGRPARAMERIREVVRWTLEEAVPVYILAFPRGRTAPFAVSDRAAGDQEVSSACGRVTVPGVARAARVACSRYAFGSTPQSFADSIRL